MSFQQIADSDMGQLACQLQQIERNRAVLSFAREVYGQEAYFVLIKNDGDTYGGVAITDVEVTNGRIEEFLPDFTLPFWQDVLVTVPDLLEGCRNDQAKLDEVRFYLRENEVYHEYGLDPDDDDVITLSELHPIEYPELYRRV